MAPGGRTNLKALPDSFTYTALIQAPSIPQISADGREVFLPALTLAPHRKKAALPLLPEQEEEEEKALGRGEHIWNQLESAECLGKNCRAGRNHSEEPRVQT